MQQVFLRMLYCCLAFVSKSETLSTFRFIFGVLGFGDVHQIWSEFLIDWVMLFIRRFFSNSGSQFEDPT
jgi:hypothetical protein